MKLHVLIALNNLFSLKVQDVSNLLQKSKTTCYFVVRSFEDSGIAALSQLLQLDVGLQLTKRGITAECRVPFGLPSIGQQEVRNHPHLFYVEKNTF